MIAIHTMEQKSTEWFAIKDEFPFSSSHAQAIGNSGKGLKTYILKSVSKKFSKEKKESFINNHIDRGNELEEYARKTYELETGNKVIEVGFITNDKYEMAGASTDGLVGEDGIIEIKCFNNTKHFKAILDYKKTGSFEIESGYIWQVQMELLITEREWCDFVIYNPNYEQELLIQRIYPDEEKQQKLVEGIKKGVEIYRNLIEILEK